MQRQTAISSGSCRLQVSCGGLAGLAQGLFSRLQGGVCGEGGALAAKGSFYFTISRCKKGNRLDFVESSLTYRKLADSWRVPRIFHSSHVLPSGSGVTCLAELVWTLLPRDIPSPHESGLLELHILWAWAQLPYHVSRCNAI